MLPFLRRLFKAAPSGKRLTGSEPTAVLALQDRIVEQIDSELPPAWQSYEIHYEYFVWEGETFEKYISTCHTATGKMDYFPSMEVVDLLLELQNSSDGGGKEKWTHVTCAFDRSGKYQFEFFYGMPPLAAKAIKFARNGT